MVKTRSADTLALDKSQQKKVTKQTKKIKKGLEDGSIQIKNLYKEKKLSVEQKRGLVYIGHIPHGFYEDEMKNYFKQFGKVTNVKVCRSRTTGNSKGYGYVEFDNPEVAQIAADTMNNYVMFKKRIVTEFVPYEKRPKGLFHGKSSTTENTSVKTRRGKQKYSRNKIFDEQTITKKRKTSLKRLASKMKKLKTLGIQCNIKPDGVEENDMEEIVRKTPNKSMSLADVEFHSDSDDVEFRKPSSIARKSKNDLSGDSKSSSYRSLKPIRSNRAVLAKSLDSVKTLMSNKPSLTAQDEETQTPSLILPKKEKNDDKKRKPKKPIILNSDAVKKIARELIRKRGNPLIKVVSSKQRRIAKKK